MYLPDEETLVDGRRGYQVLPVLAHFEGPDEAEVIRVNPVVASRLTRIFKYADLCQKGCLTVPIWSAAMRECLPARARQVTLFSSV